MQRGAWIVGLWLVIAVPVRAQSALPLELAWDAPAECGSADEVRAELARIARARPGLTLPPLRAQAHVERRAGGFAARLVTEHEGESGERLLEAADCPNLVRSVTLVLALAFGKGVEVKADGAATARADQGTPDGAAPQPPATSEAAPTTERADAATTAASARSAPASEEGAHDEAPDPEADPGVPLRARLVLGAGLDPALLPELAASGVLGVELVRGPWSLGLRVGAWPASRARVAPEVDARFDGLCGAFAGCGMLPIAGAALTLCGGALGAALRGRSEGAFDDGSDTAPWLAMHLTGGVTWPARSALGVRLEGSLALSVLRPRFVIAGYGPVHRVPLLVPRLALSVVVTP